MAEMCGSFNITQNLDPEQQIHYDQFNPWQMVPRRVTSRLQ